MPGERLMCIWQAVLAKDIFPESGVKRATVMSVVEKFADITGVTYTERRFMEVFTHQKVKLTDVISSFIVSSKTYSSLLPPVRLNTVS